MTQLGERIVERTPLVHQGLSRAKIERIRLDDGRQLVLKHIPRHGDWIARATHDEGRIATLWESGLLDRLPPGVDHGVEALEATPDGWILLRDVSSALIPDDRRLNREENRRVLEAVAGVHAAWRGAPADGLCGLADRYGLLAPETGRREGSSGGIPGMLVAGWEVFAETVPADVADPVLTILEDPAPFAAALERCAGTIVHGDVKLANLGFGPGSVVMLDWGSLTGPAPPAVELAWHIAVNASRIDASREAIIDDFVALEGERHDERALRLSLVGGLVQLGWNKATDAARHPEAAVRAVEMADLRWWVDRAREGFEVWEPERRRSSRSEIKRGV